MKVLKRNENILSRIRDIKAEHPFWGYRRVWAYLKYRDRENIATFLGRKLHCRYQGDMGNNFLNKQRITRVENYTR